MWVCVVLPDRIGRLSLMAFEPFGPRYDAWRRAGGVPRFPQRPRAAAGVVCCVLCANPQGRQWLSFARRSRRGLGAGGGAWFIMVDGYAAGPPGLVAWFIGRCNDFKGAHPFVAALPPS